MDQLLVPSLALVFLRGQCASDLQLGKLKENFLATQAFANPENISEPQTGIEPATF